MVLDAAGLELSRMQDVQKDNERTQLMTPTQIDHLQELYDRMTAQELATMFGKTYDGMRQHLCRWGIRDRKMDLHGARVCRLLGKGAKVSDIAFLLDLSEGVVIDLAIKTGFVQQPYQHPLVQLKIWPGFLLRRNWLRLAA